MSWIKPILLAVCGYALLTAAVQAEELPVAVALYPQCPLSLQVAGQSYAFHSDAIFSGPIEERAALKPEALPNEDKPAFWEYTGATSKHPFYLKCAYQDTAHYLVLNLHGAQRCTYTRADARTKCE